jgi:hypothetical protein
MAHCVNKSLPEFKALAKETGLNPAILAAKIATWQTENNNLQDFPTIEELLPIKKGVSEVFKDNPELSSIGTQEQYSEYLDNIFPDSKTKNVFTVSTSYNLHKDPDAGIQRLIRDARATNQKHGWPGGFVVYTEHEAVPFRDSKWKNYKVIINPKDGYTENVVKRASQSNSPGGYRIAVPKRIHVLGSQTDMQRFADYVSSNQLSTNSSNQLFQIKGKSKPRAKSKLIELKIIDRFNNIIEGKLGEFRKTNKLWNDFYIKEGVLKQGEQLLVEENGGKKVLFDMNLFNKLDSLGYQLGNESKEAPNKELNDKLIAWAKLHGISVESLEVLKKRFAKSGRYSNAVIGVADFMNKLIAISENKSDITTLPEEVAHFVIELLADDLSIRAALSSVVNTDEYARVKEDYAEIYKKESDFRKEALGKILAAEIIKADTYKEDVKKSKLSLYLGAAIKKFKKWIKNVFGEKSTIADIKEILEPLAKGVLQGDYLGEIADIQSNPLFAIKKLTTQEKVEEIINNKSFILPAIVKFVDGKSDINYDNINPDEATHYYNIKTGTVLERVTHIVKGKVTDKNNENLITASSLGRRVDEFVRDFFAGDLKDLSTYDFVKSDKEINNFVDSLKRLKEQFDNNGEVVVANDIILYNDKAKIAGTIDLLTYDKEGNFRIYDMKTMKGNQLNTAYGNDVVSKYDTTRYGKSNRQAHQEQLSLYRILLNNTHGIKAKELAVIPIVFNEYEPGTVSAETIELLDNIKVIPLSLVGRATIADGKSSEILEETSDVEEDAAKLEFLIRSIETLKERRNIFGKTGKKDQTKSMHKQIKYIEKQIILKEYDAAITNMLQLVTSEVGIIEKHLNNIRAGKAKMNSKLFQTASDFFNMYNVLFGSLLSEMSFWIPSEHTLEKTKEIGKFQAKLTELTTINNALIKRSVVQKLDRANRDEYGDILDETFVPKDIVKETGEDAGWWRVLTGSFGNSSSHVVRLALKTIKDSINIVKDFVHSKSRELAFLQENFRKAGYTNKDVLETNSSFLISETYLQKFEDALAKVKQEVADKLGYEKFQFIPKSELSESDLAYLNKTMKSFYAVNMEITSEIVELKDGSTITVEKSQPTFKIYGNLEFKEKMKDPVYKKYYDALLKTKEDALKKLPPHYRTRTALYLIPQIRKSFVERLSNHNNSFTTNIKELIKESVFLDADDTQFGDISNMGIKNIPIFFNAKIPISDVSFDLVNTYSQYAEMAENFKQMNEIAPDMNNLLQVVGGRTYISKGFQKKRKLGKESNEYKIVEDMVDYLIYGKERETLSKKIPENWFTKKFKLAGKELSWTKVSQKFAGYIRTNNLAWNIITSTAGFIKGTVDSKIEDQIGLYSTNESKFNARKIFAKNMPKVLADIGKAHQTNKMHLILELNEVVDISKTMIDSDGNRVVRKLLSKDIFFTNYQLADYSMKGKMTLAIYDNYRFVNDKFITKKQFKDLNSKLSNKAIDAKWKTFSKETLYDAFTVKDGQIITKDKYKKAATPRFMSIVKNRITQTNHILDGTIMPEDKGALSRSILGDYVLMHRGWFLSGVDNRFKKKTFNYNTEETEMGFYRGMWSGIRKMWKDEGLGMLVKFQAWGKLSPAERRGVKKTLLDLAYMQAMAFLAALVNIAADDEDEGSTLNYASYLLNRTLLEMKALMNPIETINIMEEPVVGARIVKELMDISEMFNFSETYDRGMYKGKTHGERWWRRRMPWRNIYELQFPAMRNRFIKSILDSGTYSMFKGDSFLGTQSSSESFFNIFSDIDKKEDSIYADWE